MTIFLIYLYHLIIEEVIVMVQESVEIYFDLCLNMIEIKDNLCYDWFA